MFAAEKTLKIETLMSVDFCHSADEKNGKCIYWPPLLAEKTV